MNIYEFKEYRDFIRAKVTEYGRLRGYQKQLAEAAGCQSSFLSHVLNSHVHLTPDHAAGLAHFWKLSEPEAEYFIGLVNLERATSPHLRRLLNTRLQEVRRQNEDLARRFKKQRKLGVEDEVTYYSAWYVAAVHMLTTIPRYRMPQAIADKLKLPLNLVQAVLTGLEPLGLVKKTKNGWVPGSANLHLPRSSKLNPVNHAAWRQMILSRLQEGHPDEVHYTAVHSLSRKDVEVFKQLLLTFIDRSRRLVEPSPEEELVCFVCDFFRFI